MTNQSTIEIPNDYEAEQAILGGIMLDNNKMYDALSVIKTPSYFYTPAHQYIFRAQIELHSKKLPIDHGTIADELKKVNQLEEVGGYIYLEIIYDCAPSSMNIHYYSKIIARHANLRQLISITSDVSKRSRDPEYEPSILIDETIDKLMEIRTNLGAETLVKKFSSLLVDVRKEVELAGHGHISYGMPTGYKEIDIMTGGGFQKTELHIIGGRPSMGKTSLAMCAGYQASNSNKKTLIIELETKDKSLLRDRLLPSISNVQSHIYRSGKLDQDQWDTFDNIIATDKALDNFSVCDKTGISSNDVYSLAKKEYETNGLDLLLLDYIQLVRASKKHSRRDQEVGEVAERLKDIAKDFNIPVIALSQLNREVEKSKRRPHYSDLRDSGELEQIADVIMLLHQDEDPEDDTLYDLIFGKNRNGKKGTIPIRFIKEFTRFQNT